MTAKTTKKAAAPKPRAPKVEITAATKLAFAKQREGELGTKAKVFALVPKKGSITVAKLQKLAADEFKVPAAKISAWVPKFVKNGLLRVAE